MIDREKVIKGLECHAEVNCVECPYRDGWRTCPFGETLLADALALLKELDAAHQGATELLRQKTILFDDAIKRLKEQQERIETLESLRRIEQEGR